MYIHTHAYTHISISISIYKYVYIYRRACTPRPLSCYRAARPAIDPYIKTIQQNTCIHIYTYTPLYRYISAHLSIYIYIDTPASLAPPRAVVPPGRHRSSRVVKPVQKRNRSHTIMIVYPRETPPHIRTEHGPAPSGTPPPAQPPPPPQTRRTQSHRAPTPLKRPMLAPEGGPRPHTRQKQGHKQTRTNTQTVYI